MSKLVQYIRENTFGIYLNANDYFAPSAGVVYLSYADYDWAFPFIEKWDEIGIEAVMCWITKRKHWRKPQSEELQKAYAELEALNPTVEESY